MSELLDLICDAVDDAFHQATGRVGINVSGGIDSSTVCCVARWLGHAFPSFTGYYDEGEAYDERSYARLATLGDNHHEIRIGPDDIIVEFDRMMEWFKPPFQGPGAMGQYIVAKYARRYAETVLSGEGGDELFGGYARLMMVAGHRLPDGYQNYTLPDGYPDNVQDALRWDYVRLPDLLAVDDQACEAWGITAVAPMTDRRVVDWALKQDPWDRVGKKLLREAVRGLVPDQIIDRTDKKGMPAPFVKWGQGPLRQFFLDRIGYLPDPSKPWDRRWWYDLCASSQVKAAA